MQSRSELADEPPAADWQRAGVGLETVPRATLLRSAQVNEPDRPPG